MLIPIIVADMPEHSPPEPHSYGSGPLSSKSPGQRAFQGIVGALVTGALAWVFMQTGISLFSVLLALFALFWGIVSVRALVRGS